MSFESWSIPGSPAPDTSVEELELSSHIRHLLLSYVQTHITTPYAQFTEVAVTDLLSGLKLIPIHDPTSLTLPTEPLTAYLSTFANSVEPYIEKLQTTNEARLLIKRLLASKPPRVAKFEDDEGGENYGYYRPSTPPIVTRRAIRETPVIGKKHELSKTYAAFTKTALHHSFHPVPVQDVPEPQVNFDQVLNVKHYIRAEDHAAVRTLLKFAAKPPTPVHIHAYLPSSLVGNTDVPQQPTPPPDSPPFMPIFPRRVPVCPPVKGKRRRDSSGGSAEPIKSRKPGTAPQSIPESMKDMPVLVKLTTDDEDSRNVEVAVDDLDICEENMVVVDGWQTFVTSSPSVLSSNSNEEDQLFLPSSPDTDTGAVVLVKAVEDSKLDDVLIPRSRKLGGNPYNNGEKARHPRMMNNGYRQFLAPLLQTEGTLDGVVNLSTTSRKPSFTQVELERVDLDSSLFGQASDLPTNEDEYDTEIWQLYARTSVALTTRNLENLTGNWEEPRNRNKLLAHPHSLIRDEPLFEDGDAGTDEKDKANISKGIKRSKHEGVGALIPVPNLPGPNTYIARYDRVATLAEYVAAASESPGNAGRPSRGFLKKARGMAGLRVALSWIPFKLSSPGDPSTHAIVTDVTRLFEDGTEEARRDDKLVQELLKHAAVAEVPALDNGEDFQGVGERLWSVLGDEDEGDLPSLDECEGLPRYDVILTREERLGIERKMNGEPQREMGQAELGEGEALDEGNAQSGSDDENLKRKGVYGRDSPDNDGQKHMKKRRLLGPDEFNDSGIGMMDDDHDVADMLDFDTEFDEGHETSGYTYGNRREDTISRDEGTFETDDEKENLPPMRQLRVDDRMGGQDDYEWMDTRQDAMGRVVWQNGYHSQSQIGNMDADYSKGLSTYQGYDVPLDAEPYLESNHSLPRMNGPTNTDFDQSEYVDAANDYDLDLDDGYGYEMLNDDRDYSGGSFEPLPLSFDSQSYQAVSARSSQVQAPPSRISIQSQPYPQAQASHANELMNIMTTDNSQNTQGTNESITDFCTEKTDAFAPAMTANQLEPQQPLKITDPPPLGPLLDLSFATHALGTAAFARLRGKTLKPNASANQTPNLEPPIQTSSITTPQATRDPPVGLHDRRTLCLQSELRGPPMTTHKYLASLDLLQKQALVRALRSPEHRIDFVERVTLDGADLILDAHAALVFVPLLSLPAQTQAEALLARVSCLSWAFERLLLVFEAYPASKSVRATRFSSSAAASSPSVVSSLADPTSASSNSGRPEAHASLEPGLYAYTPPVMKAIRKFRRDLDIAEACGTKSATCLVEYAFADSVNEAAGFSRMFGDMLEAEDGRECQDDRDSGGNQRSALWGDRAWLDCDPDEDEDGLAVIPGMNRFKAAVVLSQIALGDFLDLSPEARVGMFGGIVGVQSIMAFNEEIERRWGALEGYGGEQGNAVQLLE